MRSLRAVLAATVLACNECDVLVHQRYRGGTGADLVRQVRTKLGGRVVSARDLGIY
ncbi:MAG TPA: hypothetical protein VF737_15365 [Gemmatimonadaceae bacterium]